MKKHTLYDDFMHKYINQFVVLKSQYLFNEQIYFVDELK